MRLRNRSRKLGSWCELLDKLGIAKCFSDAVKQYDKHIVDDATLLKMVNYLGFPLKNIEQSEQLLQKLEKRRWEYAVESIYVARQGHKVFDVVLPQDEVQYMQISLICNTQNIDAEYTQNFIEEKKIGHQIYQRWEIEILTDLEPQYYDVEIETGEKKYLTVLAVSPDECYIPEVLKEKKIWGFAVQLYSLTSERNWGVGDFTDLKNFVDMCAEKGADVIGVNPLNVLFHDYPENASPYSSISRLFLNPIYIDVEKVEGFQTSFLAGKEDLLKAVRNSKNIDYTAVYNLKIGVLKKIFSAFIKKKNSVEYKKFRSFCNQYGADLQNLAVYQAIYSEYCKKVYGGWRAWPKELQNPHSKAVADFAKAHENEIEFFKYLQFVAFEQLESVNEEIKQKDLAIGLYRDLPVGLCKDSVELWSNYDLFIKDCGAGAPPDVFFPKGQKWCLGAFNPYTLKASAYLPFIKILRAAMEGAGALRIDHVMSLMRLYIIPDCDEDGTYIYYNFADMLNLVVLESYLNKCMVVGESIGNVPDGFIEKIHERGIYSLSVLWAERWNGAGDFKQPCDFTKRAFCSVGTHDMAPLKMRWFGYDIETMFQLKMISEDERNNQYKGREDERCKLLHALDAAGVWPEDKPRQGDCLFGEGYPNGILEAVEKYVSRSQCEVYLMQLEDVFGVTELQNLPGTDRDKHPNWRRKLPVNIEDYEQNEDFVRAIRAVER